MEGAWLTPKRGTWGNNCSNCESKSTDPCEVSTCHVGGKIIGLKSSWTPFLFVCHRWEGSTLKGPEDAGEQGVSEQGVSYQFSWTVLGCLCSHYLSLVSGYLSSEKWKSERFAGISPFYSVFLRQCHRTKSWNGGRVVERKGEGKLGRKVNISK